MNENELCSFISMTNQIVELTEKADSLENQLVIRTKERDAVDEWTDTRIAEIKRLNADLLRANQCIDNLVEENKRLAAENHEGHGAADVLQARNVLGAVSGETVEDAARRVAAERDRVVEFAKRNKVELDKERAEKIRLKEECDQLRICLDAERVKPRMTGCEPAGDFYDDSDMVKVRRILGTLDETERTEDAAKRVRAKLGILEATNREIGQRRNEVEAAARAVVEVHFRPTTRGKCSNEIDSPIKQGEDLIKAMNALAKILDKDPREVIDAEFVRCPEMSGVLQCVFEIGHTCAHGFGQSLKVDETVRCKAITGSVMDGVRQCLMPAGHDGEHVFRPKRCDWISDTPGEFHGARCVLPLNHRGDHHLKPKTKEKSGDQGEVVDAEYVQCDWRCGSGPLHGKRCILEMDHEGGHRF